MEDVKVNTYKALFLIGFVVVMFSFSFLVASKLLIKADPVTTSVNVGNGAPSFDMAPYDNSSGSSPTNVGNNVTFEGIATDPNGEDFYLAICKTDAITPTNGGAPTCDGGAWCVSSSASSGGAASCTYTALAGDAEANAWFAFVCDGNSSDAACSASSQPGGSTGSPFEVNHRPVFDTISNDGPLNPGSTVTWSTNTATTDSDTSYSSDTVKLIICKTAGITNDDCDGGVSDRWCASSFVANSPSCTYDVPTPNSDGAQTAYAYIVDNHYFPATGVNQGSSTDFTVNNVSPVVSAVSINSGSDITLTEGTTTSITLGGTVTDNNGCGDISSVESSMYRSGIGYASCDEDAEDDDNSCYAQVSCSVVGAGNTCDGGTDASADYTCTVSVQYFADSTVADTQYPTETWLSTLKGIDDDAAEGTAEVSTGVEMNTLVGYDVTNAIDYGSLSVGQSNDPLDKITTITATGNVGLDQELSGTDMTNGGTGSIGVSYQKYALSTATAYASGVSLSSSATEVELNCSKTTSSGSPATQNTWWGLEIPTGTDSGSYTGTNTIVAVLGETANW